MVEKETLPLRTLPIGRLSCTRVFDALREARLGSVDHDPEQVVQWWGPKGFTTTIQEMDVRPGGTWRLVMHGPDGTDAIPTRVFFSEVVKPERIVFSHSGGTRGGPGAQFESTWTFEAEGNKTKLTVRMVFPNRGDARSDRQDI